MAKGHSDKLASGLEGGVAMGKEKGVGWVYRDRRGQKIENKTDRQMFSLSFFCLLWGRVKPLFMT